MKTLKTSLAVLFGFAALFLVACGGGGGGGGHAGARARDGHACGYGRGHDDGRARCTIPSVSGPVNGPHPRRLQAEGPHPADLVHSRSKPDEVRGRTCVDPPDRGAFDRDERPRRPAVLHQEPFARRLARRRRILLHAAALSTRLEARHHRGRQERAAARRRHRRRRIDVIGAELRAAASSCRGWEGRRGESSGSVRCGGRARGCVH